MAWTPKRLLNVTLAAIFALSIIALLLANEDPFARKIVCAYIQLCHHFPRTFYKTIYDLSIGSLITLLFYFLVVWFPEYERRQRLKRSLEKHYRNFRDDCITIMLMVLDDPAGLIESDTIREPEAFRSYFHKKVTPSQTRWHVFQNKLDEQHHYKSQLLVNIEIFRQELVFVLNNTDIPKDQPFEFLKQMSAAIYSMRDVTPGYDESKPLAAFLWNVFAGWDLITGYRKGDIIKSMIDAI